jgi:hypothetical protein
MGKQYNKAIKHTRRLKQIKRQKVAIKAKIAAAKKKA